MTPPVEPAWPFRRDLATLCSALRPETIACLFVGDRSDIPLDDFLRGGSRVWLVDWRPGQPRELVADSLVRKRADGWTCLGCELPRWRHALCANRAASSPEERVCSNFILLEGFPPRCTRYAPGPDPQVMIADGTLGRAACFSTRAEEIVAIAKTPSGALVEALEESGRCEGFENALAIPADSLDLVVSVLMPPRLKEPYARFAALMQRRFGPRWAAAGAVGARAARLEAELFRMQVEGHVRELHRMVSKQRGRVYFAAETVEPEICDGWSLIPGITLTLDILGRYFLFDFDHYPPDTSLRAIPPGRIVYTSVLRPRKAVAAYPPRGLAAATRGGDDP